jgi:hypothetical protein
MSMARCSGVSWNRGQGKLATPNLRTIFASSESLNEPCENSRQIVRFGANRQVAWRDGSSKDFLSAIDDIVALQAIAYARFRQQQLWLA